MLWEALGGFEKRKRLGGGSGGAALRRSEEKEKRRKEKEDEKTTIYKYSLSSQTPDKPALLAQCYSNTII